LRQSRAAERSAILPNMISPGARPLRTVAFGYRILRLISFLVPVRARPEWIREWHAELFYTWGLEGRRRRSMISAYVRCFGAVEDALWLRIQRRDRSMLLHDLRYAGRSFARNPGFTSVVIITLALGIGANTAIFSLVDAVLLRPLPVASPSELMDVWTSCRRGSAYCTSSYPDYVDYRDRSRSFSDLAAFSSASLIVTDKGDPTVLSGALVTGNYFPLLGVRPALGRLLVPNDDVLHDPQTALVLSHRTWDSRFGRSVEMIGSTLRINGTPFTVVGVAPDGFRGTRLAEEPAFWIPMSTMTIFSNDGGTLLDGRGIRWIGGIIGRRLPGVSIEQAQSDLLSISQQLDEEDPNRSGRIITAEATRAITLPAETGADIVRFMVLLMSVVAAALLIACANVANLLLARASARRREIGIRLALGAGRKRLITQLVTESVMLSAVGALVGIGVAMLALRALSGFALPGFVTIASLDLHLDARILAFTATLAVATGVLFGLFPALQTTTPDLVKSLKAQGGQAGARRIMRTRGWLLSVQIALALVLLVGSGLFLRSLRNGLNLDVGFEARSLAMGGVSLARRQYTESTARQFVRDLTGRVAAHPGVRHVSSAVFPPLARGGAGFFITVDGYTSGQGEEMRIEANWVAADYFATLGIQIMDGRGIATEDREGAPLVAVINETMANRWWPAQNPMGRTFRQQADGSGAEITIVGVAQDVKQGLTEDPEPFIYYPMMQHMERAYSQIHILAATDGSADNLLSVLREGVRSLDPSLPVEDLQTLDNRFAEYLMPQRMGSTLLSTLGALTVLLAVVGISGVVGYSVNQRRREIGIRLALGGSSRHVLGVMARGALIPVAVGAGIGVLAAVAVTRFATTFMYDVAPTDPLTFVSAPLLLVVVALIAAYFPARRATKINATEALRTE